jgi:hypothetical protein
VSSRILARKRSCGPSPLGTLPTLAQGPSYFWSSTSVETRMRFYFAFALSLAQEIEMGQRHPDATEIKGVVP